MTETIPVKQVENLDRWISFTWGDRAYPRLNGILVSNTPYNDEGPPQPRYYQLTGSGSDVKLIRSIYDKKIGELGTHWYPDTPIEFKYAKIKIGDVVDYYTTADGVLKVPQWASLKLAVDEYLEEAPHVKFHPSRVREFVDQNGVDRLHEME